MGVGSGYFLFRIRVWVRGARGVVLAPPAGVGERVVGVVYGLELLCAGGALGGVGGDAVGVGFEGGFFVGIADLLLGCCGGDFEDSVWGRRVSEVDEEIEEVRKGRWRCVQ